MKSVRFTSNIEQDIPNIIKVHAKYKHKTTVSDFTRQPSLRRLNMTIAISNPKQKDRKPNITKTFRMIDLANKYSKILEMRQSIMKEYNSLLQLYQTNEEKLGRIIMNQLNNNSSYLYSKQILTFIKSPDIEPLRGLNFELFKHDLVKMSEFITNFNAKKRMRQVEIIKQSMLSRERMIRESSNGQQYEEIYKNMRTPFKCSAFTIYDQYKNIKVDFNLTQAQNNMSERLYNKICDAEDTINTAMRTHAQIRERHNIQFLGLSSQNKEVTN